MVMSQKAYPVDEIVYNACFAIPCFAAADNALEHGFSSLSPQ